MKIKKGTFGYLKSQKIKSALHTLVLLIVSLAIYFIGLYTAHTKANLLTVVAVLGLLPASKSAVSMIVFFRQKDCDPKIASKLLPHLLEFSNACELVLTSYEKNFPLTAVIVFNNAVYAFTENEKCGIPSSEKHILDILKQNGLKPSIKIFKELEPFINRIDSLRGSEDINSDTDQEILELIKAISL